MADIPRVLFAALLVAYVAAVFSVPVFPNQDGAVHVYYSQVLTRLWEDASAYGSVFEIQHVLPPYALHAYTLAGLNLVLEPVLSEKILVAIETVLLALGFAYLAGSIRRRPGWSLLLVFPLLFHRWLFLGFQNYCLALGILLFFCGFWLRYHHRMTKRRSAVFLMFVGAIVLAHPMAWAVACAFMAVHLLLGIWRDRKVPWGEVGHLAAAVALSAYVLAFAGDGRIPEHTIDGDWLQRRFRALRRHEPIIAFRSRELASLWSVFLPAGITLAAVGLLRRAEDVIRPAQLTLFASGVACLLVYFVAPNSVGAGYYFATRIPLFGYLFLLASAAALAVPARLRIVLTLLVAAAGCFSLIHSYRYLRSGADDLRVIVEAPVVEPGSLGALIADGKHYERVHNVEYRDSPCMWTPAHYFTRSEAVLVNAPWRGVPWMMITTREDRSYYEDNPPSLGRKFRRAFAGERVELHERLDFFIGIDCRPGETDTALFEQVAARYGLVRMPWSTDNYVFYGKQETP